MATNNHASVTPRGTPPQPTRRSTRAKWPGWGEVLYIKNRARRLRKHNRAIGAVLHPADLESIRHDLSTRNPTEES